jgi:hypothetical protein
MRIIYHKLLKETIQTQDIRFRLDHQVRYDPISDLCDRVRGWHIRRLWVVASGALSARTRPDKGQVD